jgi:hypothetical protein
MTTSDSTTTPAVPLPIGAVFVGDWEPDDIGSDAPQVRVRYVSSPKLRIIGSPVILCVDGWQQENRFTAVAMNITPAEELLNANADQCRELAAHLLELAPLLDTWSAAEVAE